MDTPPYKMSFTLESIHNDPDSTQKFIQQMQPKLPCLLIDAHNYASTLCPELKPFCDSNQQRLVGSDKGSAGKLTELFLFGRVPNNDASPDLTLGDIKATHVKKVGSFYNAKERLTVTNVGSTLKPDTLQHIVESAKLQNNKSYAKVRNGILAVFERNKSRPTMEEILQEKLVALFHYDLESLPVEIRALIDEDYCSIVKCVQKNEVSQKGQQYLHIHPHGSKGSKTRAFGFTNKFVTWLICHYTSRPLIKKGRSWMFSI
jgi:hypothetical protein